MQIYNSMSCHVLDDEYLFRYICILTYIYWHQGTPKEGNPKARAEADAKALQVSTIYSGYSYLMFVISNT